MAKRLQHRGGTTSQHSSFTGAVREVTVDTDKNTLVVHDGATAGGHPLATATNFTSTGIDDNATSTAISIDSSQNVSFNDDTGNTAKMVWNATDESLKINAQYGDYYVAYKVPQLFVGGVTSDLVLIIGEKDVNQLRITGRFYTPTPYPLSNNRNVFSVDILYQQWNSQLPRFSYDAIHTGSRASHVNNMELAEVVYNGTTYYAITIQANTSSLGGQPIYFTGGITNTTDLGWVTRDYLTSYTAVTPSSNDTTDKRINAESIRFKNEKNEDKMLITTGGDISFYEDTGTTPQFFWDASTERLGIGTSSPSVKLHILGTENEADTQAIRLMENSTQGGFIKYDGIANELQLGGFNSAEKTGIRIARSDASTYFNTNGSERMRINSSGKVGIGETSMDALLVIKGDSDENTTPSIRLKDGSDSREAWITNAAGDLILSAGGNDDVAHTQLRMLNGNIMTFKTDNTERMRIDSSGNLLIGKTSPNIATAGIELLPSGRIQVTKVPNILGTFNSLGNGEMFRFLNNGTLVGGIVVGTSSTSYNTSSDYRLKENVNYDFDATTRLKQLKPARFNFIADANKTVDGFLAHEVSDIVPEAISRTKDATETKEKVVVNANGNVIAEDIEQADWETGKIADEEGNTKYPTDSTWEATKVIPVYQGIDQSKLVPLLVKTIQELEARITALETQP